MARSYKISFISAAVRVQLKMLLISGRSSDKSYWSS